MPADEREPGLAVAPAGTEHLHRAAECIPEVTLTVPGYDPARGAVIQPEGGDVVVRHGGSGVEILADRAGLRDLARWCLALADEQVPDGAHVHLDREQRR
jgi:hypothetical protein